VDYRWFEEAFHFYLIYLNSQKQVNKNVFPNVHFTMLLPCIYSHRKEISTMVIERKILRWLKISLIINSHVYVLFTFFVGNLCTLDKIIVLGKIPLLSTLSNFWFLFRWLQSITLLDKAKVAYFV
jgi:hypothetical protein